MSSLSLREQPLMFAALLSGAATIMAFGFVAVIMAKIVPAPGCTEILIDFHPIWAAGRLSLAGTPLAAFDQELLVAAYNGCDPTQWLPWLHPAPMMTLMTAIAALPMLPAILLFNAISLFAFGWALRSFAAPSTPLYWAIVLSPALLPALAAGQVVILWMACLLGMITGLRHNRPWLAGACVALMTLKPTLGLLIPFVLLAISQYRVIGIAIAGTILLHGAATLIHGVGYWPLWFETSEIHVAKSIAALGHKEYLASFAAFLAEIGVPNQTAATANLAVAGVLAVFVFAVWRRLGATSDISAALLCVAIPLSSSYLWLYDTAFFCLAAMFLFRAAPDKQSVLLWLLLAALWVAPGAMIWNFISFDVAWFSPVNILPPLMLTTLFVCLAKAYNASNAQPA